MRLIEGIIIEKLDDHYVGVPTGKASELFNGMIQLNDTAYFLMNCLNEKRSKEELVQDLMKHYGIDESLASQAVESFINEMKQTGLLYE